MNYDLVGIGNALVDIEVQVDDSFVEEISVTKGGMTLSSADEQEKVLNALKSKPRKLSSGGSAANTIHGASVLGAILITFVVWLMMIMENITQRTCDHAKLGLMDQVLIKRVLALV